MRTSKVTIRQAEKQDAELIAQVVAMAIGDEQALHDYCGEEYHAVLTEVVLADKTQYSWHNALIAEVDGVAAGAIVGYDGALLGSLREGTFEVVRRYTDSTPSIPDETEAGEFYLDSVATLPSFRGQGIGRALIKALYDKAFALGHQHVGLIVDVDNPRAERLYTSLGFERVGSRLFFGHQMWHLQSSKDKL
ncbi:MAG: GNAT family N-acetyltransferase [Rikenellaceae bacterium]|nr:GNAT family N-acetyltransferase [Rikenellaceae bacterium]